jgi:S-phase kinase-associated protein 1
LLFHLIFDLIFGIQIDRKLAGNTVEHTFVINSLDFYLRFDDECTRKRFEGIIKTITVGDAGNIIVHKVSSQILSMVIEYCKKHKHNNGLKDFELKEFDAQFVNVEPKTLLDLTISAYYLKVDSLVKLTWSKIDNLIKGKTPEEISQIFGAADHDLNNE